MSWLLHWTTGFFLQRQCLWKNLCFRTSVSSLLFLHHRTARFISTLPSLWHLLICWSDVHVCTEDLPPPIQKVGCKRKKKKRTLWSRSKNYLAQNRAIQRFIKLKKWVNKWVIWPITLGGRVLWVQHARLQGNIAHCPGCRSLVCTS